MDDDRRLNMARWGETGLDQDGASSSGCAQLYPLCQAPPNCWTGVLPVVSDHELQQAVKAGQRAADAIIVFH